MVDLEVWGSLIEQRQRELERQQEQIQRQEDKEAETELWALEDMYFRRDRLAEVVMRYRQANADPRFVVNLLENNGLDPCEVLDLLDAGQHPDEVWYTLWFRHIQKAA
jgi:hypothetical protein